jgi:S1-C subfamily serine protease
MNPSSPSPRPSVSNLLSGVLGGLVVLIIGAVLIATDVIDTGDTTREVVQGGAVAQPVADSGSSNGSGRTVSQIYKEEGRGVVFIQARGVSSGQESPFGAPDGGGTATGSGFVVDRDGTIITNAHVVEGAREVQVRFGENEDFVDAKVAGRDASTDIAVLKVNPDDAKLTPIPLGDSSKVSVGDAAIAIGNPFGFSRTVTTGIVSALQRQITAPNGFQIPNVIQTDASINPGNSGGPLLDSQGRVIGINSQIATGGSSSGSVGIGFAVPIDTAKSLLPKLKQGDKIERAYLGVRMAAVTDQVAKDLNLPAQEGALIQSVENGGPADDAGLKGGRTPTGEGLAAGGDLIVEVDGRKVGDPDDVSAAIGKKQPGDTVRITVYRGNDKKTVEVKLGKRPSNLNADDSSQGDGGGGLFP